MALLMSSQYTAAVATRSSSRHAPMPPPPTLRRRPHLLLAAASSSSPSSSQQPQQQQPQPPQPLPQDPLEYGHLLVALIDSNPYLSSASQGAVAASAGLAAAHGSKKITVLLIDEPGKSSGDSAGADPSLRLKTVAWHLRERGCEGVPFDMLERAVAEKGAASALVGETADEVGADLLVMSSGGVHDKHVDANLLAEFVSCPLLLLP